MAVKTEGDKGSDMGWGAVIGAAAGVGGGLLGNYLNSREMRKQREWMEKMSNSAHQREVEDLRNAGLNPILSATGGNGASTPQGQLIPMEDPIEKGINSALAVRGQESEIALRDAQARQSNTQAGLNINNASLILEQQEYYRKLREKTDAEIDAINAGIGKTNAETKNLGLTTRYGNGFIGDIGRTGESAFIGAGTLGQNLLNGYKSWAHDTAIKIEKAAAKYGVSMSDLLGSGKRFFNRAANSAIANLSNNKSGTD